MVTDPQRARKSDPGNPDVCNVFSFHRLYSAPETPERVDGECRRAEIGCVECKKWMAESLVEALAPIREKRSYFESRPEMVKEIMDAGNKQANRVAAKTMEEVREAMQI
jgi:tryptophanyl-tRNA synthetase